MIATSASYQASFDGFARRGLGRRDAAGLMRRSVELAREARAEMAGDGRARWVAASVGPYGAALADGSEYRGRYGLSVPELAEWHRPRLEALAEAEPDVLALETVPDTDEAEALMAAIAGLGIPAWLSYTIDAERTCAGQSLAEAFAIAADVPEVVAVGVNCCAPADVPAAIATAQKATGKPVIVYPNSGEGWDARRRAWTGRSRHSAGLPRQWIAAGARIVGGCCRVRPADIAVIADAAKDAAPAHAVTSARSDVTPGRHRAHHRPAGLLHRLPVPAPDPRRDRRLPRALRRRRGAAEVLLGQRGSALRPRALS